MKAIFKPEDANKIIVRDADINEASLIINFLDKIKNGATLEAQATFNGNYETNGILFSVADAPKSTDTPICIPTEAIVTNDTLNMPVFKIDVKSTGANYVCYKVDTTVWETFKVLLEGLGLDNISVTSEGSILADNETGSVISASIVIPRGLFQYVNSIDSTTNNFNDNIMLTLGE